MPDEQQLFAVFFATGTKSKDCCPDGNVRPMLKKLPFHAGTSLELENAFISRQFIYGIYNNALQAG